MAFASWRPPVTIFNPFHRRREVREQQAGLGREKRGISNFRILDFKGEKEVATGCHHLGTLAGDCGRARIYHGFLG